MPWRWPYTRAPETREAGGGYTEIISRLIEAQAAGTTQQASATAATEAVAGLLSRSFSAAMVEPDDVAEIVTPRMLGQCGRDLVRVGESLHVIRLIGDRFRLLPASTWYFWGGADPSQWEAVATVYGPSHSSTWRVPQSSVIFVAWGSPTARPYHGLSPNSWAAETSRLHANAERALADEAGGPVAGLLTVPEGKDSGSDDDKDELAPLRKDIAAARGRALLLETTASGYGEGRANAPMRDFDPRYLHPAPTESMVKLADAAFARVLAASGCSPALFDDSDGTSKREALRQWHLGTVVPLARLLERELTDKFDQPVKLRFDSYATDLVGRVKAFKDLMSIEGMTIADAMTLTGLMDEQA